MEHAQSWSYLVHTESTAHSEVETRESVGFPISYSLGDETGLVNQGSHCILKLGVHMVLFLIFVPSM